MSEELQVPAQFKQLVPSDFSEREMQIERPIPVQLWRAWREILRDVLAGRPIQAELWRTAMGPLSPFNLPDATKPQVMVPMWLEKAALEAVRRIGEGESLSEVQRTQLPIAMIMLGRDPTN